MLQSAFDLNIRRPLDSRMCGNHGQEQVPNVTDQRKPDHMKRILQVAEVTRESLAFVATCERRPAMYTGPAFLRKVIFAGTPTDLPQTAGWKFSSLHGR